MPGTRDRIVFAAMDLFHRQGYEATSIGDVLAAADANAGSLYHFFPGKEALLLAVLDAYLAGLWPVVMAPAFARTDDPIERVFEVLKDYRERVRSTECTYNCPIGSLALEVSHTVPGARRRSPRTSSSGVRPFRGASRRRVSASLPKWTGRRSPRWCSR